MQKSFNLRYFILYFTHKSFNILLQAALSRKQMVIRQKRAVIVENEEKFGSLLFEHTTDEDYPPFSFEF
jgi:hypothetical protein